MAEETKQEPDVDAERKEEFGIGLSDEQLLAQITLWEQEAEDFYSRLKRIWEVNLRYYKGLQTDVDKIYGKQSKAVENRIFMAVETMIPIATARLPEIVVKPGEDNEQSQIDAGEHGDLLAYQFERVGIQALGERWVRDMIVKRYGVFKMFWDKENDDVGLRVVDPRRVKIPIYGKTIDELKFLIEDLELSHDSLVLHFGEEKTKELLKNAGQESESKIREKSFSVSEVWTNDFVVWKSGSLILKKEENPYWKKGEDNFFDKAKKPYVIKSLFETEDSLIGDTDYLSQTISVQDNINIRKRQIEDITNKVANPALLIDSEVMSEEQAAAITNEPGLVIYGKDAAAGTKIKFESPGQVPQYLFSDLQFSRQEFDNIWGIHSTTRGEREGRETATGRQILREADLGRIDLIGRQLERALDEIAEYWTQLVKLFYTEEKTFTILGEDGVRFVKSFTGSRVGKVKPMVKPGSTLKEDEFTIKQNAILLWQNKAIGLKTLYKMLRMPNMAEAIDDFVETQSGALLQQKGGGSLGAGPLAAPAEAPPVAV